jgi:hypothetical protein
MNDMAAANRRGQPANRHEREARRDDQGSRLSDFIRASGQKAPRKQAGHMTAADQSVRNVKKSLANRGRPHMTIRAEQLVRARGV